MTTYTCPECESSNVVLIEEHSFMANTFEHYCFSVKVQDSDSKARCLDCEWTGFHRDLVGYKEN